MSREPESRMIDLYTTGLSVFSAVLCSKGEEFLFVYVIFSLYVSMNKIFILLESFLFQLLGWCVV